MGGFDMRVSYCTHYLPGSTPAFTLYSSIKAPRIPRNSVLYTLHEKIQSLSENKKQSVNKNPGEIAAKNLELLLDASLQLTAIHRVLLVPLSSTDHSLRVGGSTQH